MIQVLGADYVRTARAKGLGEGRVIFRHALQPFQQIGTGEFSAFDCHSMLFDQLEQLCVLQLIRSALFEKFIGCKEKP